jgi:lipopolysaccharide export system permease protein
MKQDALVSPEAGRPISAAPRSRNSYRLLIVDRYLLRQFVQSFLICFISLTGLYVVIDGFTKLDEFISYAATEGSLLVVMGQYYAYRTLSFFDSTSQILTLIAAMFTLTWIQRYNELTALESAGIPKWRVLRPIVGAVVMVSLMSAANREFIIPLVREDLGHSVQDLGGTSGKHLAPRYDNETDVLLGSSSSLTFAREKRIENPDFYLPSGLNRYGARLVAKNAFYEPPRADRPAGYRFVEVLKPTGLDREPSLSLDGVPVLMTARDCPWVNPGECFLKSNVSFEHLEADSSWHKFSGTAELIRGLRNRSLDFGAKERLIIHSRLVRPLLDVTLLFLGLPLMLSRSKRNVFLAIGMCMALVITFMIVVFACEYLGSSYLIEPALAAWLPLMIFIPCAVALSQPLHQ